MRQIEKESMGSRGLFMLDHDQAAEASCMAQQEASRLIDSSSHRSCISSRSLSRPKATYLIMSIFVRKSGRIFIQAPQRETDVALSDTAVAS